MAATEIVGQSITLTIGVVDQTGLPLAGVLPDSPPQWSQVNPAAESLTVAGDGMSAVALGLAPGTDTVQAQATFGSKLFTATIVMTIDARATPVVGGIVITAGTPA